MVEGLEVIIKYRGAKHDQVASPATPSAAFPILKKDLAHLRVHSPSQRNVRRVNGSFILHWPMAGTSPKVEGIADSLHTRWFKLCSDDPEALKLREFLSIKSITMTQGGILIRSTVGAEPPPEVLAERLGDPLSDIAQQPVPVKPQEPPPLPPPPMLPSSAPRSDRQSPNLKRRMSSIEGPSSSTRQKLDAPDVQITTSLRSTDTQPQQPHPSISPKVEQQPESSTLGDAVKAVVRLTPDDAKPLVTPVHALHLPIPPESQATSLSPQLEPGEMTPHTPLPNLTPVPTRSPSGLGPGLRPPPASPYPSSSSSGNGDPHASHRRDRDVSRLMRELWDTREQLTAVQAREQIILDDLERLGARPESAVVGVGADQNELLRLEDELKAERTRRMHAEQALSDVERECRAPFVVPALFQAFMSISELSN